MDKTFTFRFYSVSRSSGSIPSMADMLRSIAKEQDLTLREKLLATNYTVRLENLEDDGPNAIVGEMVRCQQTNLPSEISKGKRSALKAERLGHSIVFRLNHATGQLGVQYDPRVVSPGKILEYIVAHNVKAIYRIDPLIDEDAWQRFQNSPAKKLVFRIANPENIGQVAGDGEAAASALQRMGDAYSAPFITVEISMGGRKGALDKVAGLARALVDLGGGARLDSMKAKILENDEAEEIDLIQERKVVKDSFELHDRDPVLNWNIKKDRLCAEMKKLIG